MSNSTETGEFALELRNEIESRREEIVELCAELVSALSINPEGDTRKVAEVVYQFLEKRNMEPIKIAAVETMPSVMASIDSGKSGKHLVLNVHLDTMPPGDETLWSAPPFELTRREGKLFGLGMGNMKGAVAAMLHAFNFLQRNKDLWSGKVTFTAVSDEVVFGVNGAGHLLNEYPELFADALICGEGPGFKRLANGEKGVLWLRLTANAEGGHSSSVIRGQSASAKIARAVAAIDQLTGLAPGILVTGSVDQVLSEIATDRDKGDGQVLSVNIGTISSGTFIGQVSTSAQADVDLRLPPGITVDEAESLVQKVLEREVGVGVIDVKRIKGWNPNVTDPKSSIVQAWNLASALSQVPEPELAVRLPASDASRWRQRGVDAICYGPQPTASAGIDDFAFEDEVLTCVALYTLAGIVFLNSNNRSDPVGK